MTGTQLTFLARLGSSLALWALAIGIIFSGHPFSFFLMISVIALLGLNEFYAMLERKGLPCFRLTATICAAVYLAGSFYFINRWGVVHSYDFENLISLVVLLVIFGRQMFQPGREAMPLERMAYTIFGLVYIPGLFNFTTKIVFADPGHGHFWVLYGVVITKFSDMGAYVTGMLMGKHPMVPQISPKKTWEGFCGAVVFSLLGSYGMLYLIPSKIPQLNWTHATVLGLLLGLAAIIGDLAESVIKRSCDAKDSGRMLPGIGGILDLIDSLLFTLPLLFFYLRLVVRLA